MGKNIQKNRVYWLDVARVIAIISISMNHAVNRVYDNYDNTVLEFYTLSVQSNLLKAYISVFSRIGVPLFLMISGYLLLNKRMEDKRDIQKFYRHNLLSLLVTSEIWYVIMFWFRILWDPSVTMLAEQGIKTCIGNMFLTMLFTNQITMGSMWYIPMILCIYMIIPIVNIILKRFSSNLFLIPLAIVFVSGMLVPAIGSYLNITESEFGISFALSVNNLFSAFLIYVLAGYWIGNKKCYRIPTWIITVGMLASFFLCGAYQFWAYSKPGNYLISYEFPGILICAAFTFEFIRRTARGVARWERPVIYLSKISFGIYFVHIIIMSALVWYGSCMGRAHWMRLLFLEGVSFGGSVLVIALLSKVSVLKKYLFHIRG
jgi:surface polysaccharide O-acyltransferase-like enzyme